MKFDLTEMPSLTIAVNPRNAVFVGPADAARWSLSYCQEGYGDSDAEAVRNLGMMRLDRLGGTVTLAGSSQTAEATGRGYLNAEAPPDARMTILAFNSAVEVCDLAGDIRVAVSGARARFINATGRLDAFAPVIDFVGTSGCPTLNAGWDLNVMVTSPVFEGTLVGIGQRAIKVLLPARFLTRVEVVVGQAEDFVCRSAISFIRTKSETDPRPLFVSNDTSQGVGLLRLFSEGKVVIDAVVE